MSEQDERERVGGALRVLLGAFFAGSGVISALCLLVGWYETFWTVLAVALSSAFALLLGRAGHERTGAIIAFLFVVLALCYAAYQGNGLHDLSVLFLPVMILSASLVLSGATFVLFSVAAIVAVSSVVVARWYRGIPDPVSTQPLVELAILVIALAVSAIGGRLLALRLEHHLARARENEARYRAIFESIQDVYYEVRPDGTVVEMSSACREVFGVDRHQMLGRSLRPYYASAGAHEGLLATLRERRRVTNYELAFQDASGRERSALVSASLVGQPGDPGEKVVASIRDVTDRRLLEERLVQAQRMESLGRLAGGIAHDFNNLLTVIIGHCGLARRRLRKGAEPAADIDAIENAGLRAADLTRQLLAFSRRQAHQPKVVDVAALFDRFRPMIRTLAGEDVDVETTLAPDVPHVLADPGQLEQVLLNLLVNARDAVREKADPAHRRVSIRLSAVEHAVPHGRAAAPEPCLLLEVADGGVGMTPEVRRRIFEPFFTTKETGTGMGLATVYGIIRQNDGDIEVESVPGSGTRFRIYWPASEGTPQPDPEAVDPHGDGTECVLLVEDEEAVRSFARAALSSRGYRVLEADSGPQALALLQSREQRVDAMVTDLLMPGMDGRDLADRARQLRPGLPVLFTTGYAGEGSSAEGASPEERRVLRKPFSDVELARRLRETLGRASPPERPA